MLSEKRKVVISRSTYKALEISNMIHAFICDGVEHEVSESTISFEKYSTFSTKVEVSSHLYSPEGGCTTKVSFEIVQEINSGKYTPAHNVMLNVKVLALGLEFNLRWANEACTNLKLVEPRFDDSENIFQEVQKLLGIKK